MPAPHACPRRRDGRGAAAVEFALVVPLLLFLVFGIIDFGWMLMKANLVNNAARDAARVASLSGTYEQVDQTVDSGLAAAGISPSDVTVLITCTNGDGTTCDGSASSFASRAVSGSTVTVTLSYDHPWLTPLGATCDLVGGDSCVGDTIVLERTATMVRE
ncbi:TadE/TadG family type IV pilus assembly protein [Nocardioides marmotae]|uniref:TadE/TadG family type IV pilus assembly protein n=1 Tax=Nocardioides marmotae TaxID=2663857 RepID=UPI0016595CBA|nr:TadE/TadG family type IV pilus assembly protein [Nocardioides marmotae]MBC9732260.1 pilus assembly protein [Nocardioides marmotae]